MQHRLSDVTLLLRFRESRDPEAFRLLFERYSVPLWRRACKATSACDADDLVQSTFLSVIESVESFDENYDVKPWLFGILGKHLLMRARRDVQRTLDPARVRENARAQEVASACDVVSVDEVRERLGLAVSDLPRPYREVVAARYERALPPREIAASFEREVGTVRKQIHRGLAMLRKALPAEIAMALLAFLTPRRLQAATARGGAARAAGAGSALALLGVVLVFWNVRGARVAAPLEPDGAPRGRVVAAGLADADAIERESARGASRAESEARREASAGTVRVRFRGGASACALPMRAIPRRAGHFAELQLGRDVRELRTNAEGDVDLSTLAPGHYSLTPLGGLPRLHVSVDADGSITRRAFRVGPRRRVSGRVLDAAGRAVVGARLYASATQGRGDAGDVVARSDARGRYDLTLACEQPWLWASAGDAAPSRPILLGDGEEQQLDLRLAEAGARVAGTVLYEGGSAAADAIVAWFPAHGLRGDVAPVYARCDSEGRFDLGCVRVGAGSVFAQREGFACAWRVLAEDSVEAPLALRLARGQELRGVVRDPMGRALSGAFVQVTPAPVGGDQLDGSLRNRSARTDEDGRYHIRGLGVGPVAVFTLHAPLGLRAKRFVELPSTRVCDLDCTATSFLTGRVVDHEGRALAGWELDGVPSEGADARMRTRWKSTCRTRADGSFRLQLTRNVPYRVAVFAPEHAATSVLRQPWVVREGVRGAERVELRVPARAASTALVGRLGADARAKGATLQLEHVAWNSEKRVPVARDGSFRVAALPPARYRAYLVQREHGRRELADFELTAGRVFELGRVDVAPPAALELHSSDVDLSGASVMLRDAHGCFLARRKVGPSGRLRMRALAAGRYQVLVASRFCEPTRHELICRPGCVTRLDVRAAPATPCTIELDYHPVGMPFFRRGPVHVRVSDTRGRKVFEDILFADEDDHVRSHCGLPAGAYRMEATCLGGRSISREIQIGDEPFRVDASMQ